MLVVVVVCVLCPKDTIADALSNAQVIINFFISMNFSGLENKVLN
jgi:hypothetical protein